MPRIRQVLCAVDRVLVDEKQRTYEFPFATLPKTQNSEAKAEAYLNSWLASRVTDYQVVAHVFSLSPLVVTLWVGDLDTKPPVDWWLE